MRMQGYSPKDFMNLLIKNGWNLTHRKSNHITFKKPGFNKHITITESRKEMSRPLTKRLMKEAGLLN